MPNFWYISMSLGSFEAWKIPFKYIMDVNNILLYNKLYMICPPKTCGDYMYAYRVS